jgi:uncharacterized spore protein YtfJ
MLEQIYGEPVHPSDSVIITEQVVNNPVVNMDSFADNTPEDAALINDTPLGETLATVDPIPGIIVRDAPTVEAVPLLNLEESEHLRKRWMEIQVMFVDDPQSAVQKADALVSEMVENIIQMFASEHKTLEVQWNQGKDLSTEDLRKSLQHYRSFFNRLVG